MFLNRHTRTKGACPGRGSEHYCRQIAMGDAIVEGLTNLAHHRNVEDVQGRTIESNTGHAIIDAEFDVLVSVCHWPLKKSGTDSGLCLLVRIAGLTRSPLKISEDWYTVKRLFPRK